MLSQEKLINQELFDFIEDSPSVYHVVEYMRWWLSGKGYTELFERDKWNLERGGKYFTTRNSSSVVAFQIPDEEYTGFNIASSHSDSPTFKIKELSEMKVEANYTKLNVEGYGGMIMSTWMDKPLSVAGRVTVKTENGIKSILVNIDRDFCVIPNVAIHMQREINDGYKFNPQVDMLPLIGDETADFTAIIAENAGVNKDDIISSDLFLYNRQTGTFVGANEEFIMVPKLDDLQCAFATMKGFILSAEKKNSSVRVCAVFDNEEVGSGTKQGADSTLMYDVLTRINFAMGGSNEDFLRKLSGSFMVSADNAHAVHPNFPEKIDATNRNYINKGVVIKFNAGQKYTTDGISSALFKTICERAEAPYQIFHNRSDMRGGSTLGNIANAHVSLNTVDIGLPQLSMHSSCETAGAKDTASAVAAMKEFFSSAVTETGNGEYTVAAGK